MEVVKRFGHLLLRTIQLLTFGLVAFAKAVISVGRFLKPDAAVPPQFIDAAQPPPEDTPSALETSMADNAQATSKSITSKSGTSTTVALSVARWYGTGLSIDVQGFQLSNPMLYIGQSLDSLNDPSQPDPCLIQPNLAVNVTATDAFPACPRVLSYATLSDHQRYIFLDWLASERTLGEVDTAYIFLFLFGLERRIISELRFQENGIEELLALTLELERLQSLYGIKNESLSGFIQGLLEVCQIQLARICQPETLLALLPQTDQPSLALKVAIGNSIQSQKPIPMPLLWAWYQKSPLALDLRTPAKRCAPEFDALINLLAKKTPVCIKYSESLPRFTFKYQPHSHTFGMSATEIVLEETINIEAFADPVAQLQPLIDDCTTQLDAYSRLLGRSPELQGSPSTLR